MAETKPEDREDFFAQEHEGVVAFKDGLGFFIQPEDDERALVGFLDVDPNKLPEGFEVGQKVKFKLDRESQGANASKWEKVEDKQE